MRTGIGAVTRAEEKTAWTFAAASEAVRYASAADKKPPAAHKLAANPSAK
jgi:hypothetical protein